MALNRVIIREKIFLDAVARARLKGRPSDKAKIQRIWEESDAAAVEAMKVVGPAQQPPQPAGEPK